MYKSLILNIVADNILHCH